MVEEGQLEGEALPLRLAARHERQRRVGNVKGLDLHAEGRRGVQLVSELDADEDGVHGLGPLEGGRYGGHVRRCGLRPRAIR